MVFPFLQSPPRSQTPPTGQRVRFDASAITGSVQTSPDHLWRRGVQSFSGNIDVNSVLMGKLGNVSYQRSFPTDTTKDEKWLVLVGRPSLAASRWRARRPAPPGYFHIKAAICGSCALAAKLELGKLRFPKTMLRKGTCVSALRLAAHPGAPLHFTFLFERQPGLKPPAGPPAAAGGPP